MDPVVKKGCVGPDSEVRMSFFRSQKQQAGMADACKDCPFREQCLKNRNDPAIGEIQKNLEKVKHKILVLSGKGGVGKSTVAAQLALNLSFSDNVDDDDDDVDDVDIPQVGVLDVDLCGPSMPTMFGVENNEVRQSSVGYVPVYHKDNLGIISIGFLLQRPDQPVIFRGPKKNSMIVQFLKDVFWGDEGLDYMIVDTPPGTSDEHLTVVRYLSKCDLDGAVIVTTPQDVSVIDVRREITFCRKSKIKILGLIENMSGFSCPKCGTTTEIFKATNGGGEALAKETGIPFLGKIPLDPNVMKVCENGKALVKEFPKSPASKSFLSITQKIKKMVEGGKKEDKKKEKEK